MATILSDRKYSPEDLQRMPESERFELVNGRLVETDMSALACWIATLMSIELGTFVRKHKHGVVLSSDTQYQCFPDDPRRIRKPDLSFIERSRITEAMLQGFVRIAPDIAVEVVSEHDTYYEVESKVREYLQAGVRLVWILNPVTSSIRVYRLGGGCSDLSRGELLTGEEVLPGFSAPVEALFEPMPMGKPAG